ncbi:MAG TPA: alpha/beta hydrolase [Flavobacteriales bacterium]
MTQTFTHGFTLVHRTYGHGPLPVIAFHGFGRTGEDFAFLEGYWAERCTVYAFDLPFHGESPWTEDRIEDPFAPEEFAAFFAAFADHIGARRISVLGYSLGGRMALCLLERIPDRITKAFLVAPDGLKHRPWYRGLAGSAVGRALYAHFIDHPVAVHGLVKGLRKAGLLNERLQLFILGQSDTREKRRLLRAVWLSLRRIEPELPQVAAHARSVPFTIQLVFGARDRVIRPEFAHELQGLAPDRVKVQLIPTGHVLLIPELGEWLATQAPA